MNLRRRVVSAVMLGSLLAASGAALSAVIRDRPGAYGSIARGRYLTRAGDCMACHTAAGGEAFAGGRAVPTPFGVIYSTNITPDPTTGIGSWSQQDFYRAMHHGIDRQGKHLYPAFPYPWFSKLSRDDVLAIKAYLDTVTPVHQRNLANVLPWPFSMRGVMAVWNGLYFDAGVYRSDTKRSAQWNRGAYLVQGAGHCSACHGEKNLAGAVKSHHALTGGEAENAFAPSLAGNVRAGLGGWSRQDIVDYLGTGRSRQATAAGPMAEVVQQSTQYLSKGDLQAIAIFLKSQPATETDEPDAIDADVMKRGGALYTDNCEGCHLRGGTGEPDVSPTLKGSSAVQAAKADTVIGTILQGARVPATAADPTGLAMPAFSNKLDDADIAAVSSYIRNAWGNKASAVSASDVRALRHKLHDAAL